MCIRDRAYSPLTRGRRLGDPTLVAIAKEVGRTPAQTILRWGVQHDLVVLPKSTRDARIAENGALFDFTLPDSAMRRLDSLDEGHATGWDPRDQK